MDRPAVATDSAETAYTHHLVGDMLEVANVIRTHEDEHTMRYVTIGTTGTFGSHGMLTYFRCYFELLSKFHGPNILRH